jgi:rhamnosyl/mannosyltransferase
MKVLQIGKYYPPHWGGMETALKDICEGIAGEVELEVLVANDRPGDTVEKHSGFLVRRLANWRTVFSQPLTPGLLRRVRASAADIVHLHEPNPLALACYLASGHRGRLVVHYHSDIVRQRKLKWFYRPILKRGLKRAEAIIAGSRELVEGSPDLQEYREKCLVIPFGIDLRRFLAIDPAERRARGGPRRILAVGRLSYYKGFQYLIRAMASLNAHLTIAGEGELRPALESQVASLGLEARVQLAGRVGENELLELYRQADVFCLPSCERSEAFGLVMVEAMGAALPVVSTDLPTGVRAVNRNRETGIVTPPGDAGALSQALGELLDDEELRWRYGLAGRERASRLFSREAMAGGILRLYRTISGGGKEGPA